MINILKIYTEWILVFTINDIPFMIWYKICLKLYFFHNLYQKLTHCTIDVGNMRYQLSKGLLSLIDVEVQKGNTAVLTLK